MARSREPLHAASAARFGRGNDPINKVVSNTARLVHLQEQANKKQTGLPAGNN